VRDGNPTAMSIFLRHYSAKQRRKLFQFVGPGEKMVLLTPDARALFVWRKEQDQYRLDGQTGVNCAVFRREGGDRASDLIRSAVDLAMGTMATTAFVHFRQFREGEQPESWLLLHRGWLEAVRLHAKRIADLGTTAGGNGDH
jgi:hypothetical protein